MAPTPLTPAQPAASELRKFWVCLLIRIREVQQPIQQDLNNMAGLNKIKQNNQVQPKQIDPDRTPLIKNVSKISD